MGLVGLVQWKLLLLLLLIVAIVYSKDDDVKWHNSNEMQIKYKVNIEFYFLNITLNMKYITIVALVITNKHCLGKVDKSD